MMNYIWAFIIILSIAVSAASGNAGKLSDIFLTAGNEAVELSLTLLGGMCFWGGIMQIAEKARITDAVSAAVSPLLSLVMPDLKRNKSVRKAVTMNVAANLLGLGNAATPLGLKAMKELNAINREKGTASDSMVTFVVLNTASIQLIPSTVALLRTKNGAASSLDILPCVWLTSITALTVGLIVDRILSGSGRCTNDSLYNSRLYRAGHNRWTVEKGSRI